MPPDGTYGHSKDHAGAFFTPVPDLDMSEPQFLNKLYAEEDCGTLLDLHNIYVSARNGGIAPNEYLDALNPDAVVEIRLFGTIDGSCVPFIAVIEVFPVPLPESIAV